MATIFLDGFDKYGPVSENSPTAATLLAQNEWTSTTGGMTVVAGLSSTGTAMQMNNSLLKTLSASYSRLIGGFRFTYDFSGFNTGIQFQDAATAQSSININPTTGTISVRTGGVGGAALTTSTVAISASSVHYLEWDITFGASSAYQVWLDGVSIISGTGATRSTTNNSANQINFTTNTGTFRVDDFYLFDTTGSSCNAVLNTNPRIETQYPSSDSQTQWTNAGNTLVPNGIVQTGISNVTASTSAPGANQLVLLQVKPAVNCTLNSVGILPAASSAGANFKAVLYADSAGAPAALTSGSTTQVTGVTSGTTLTLAFNTPQSLTGGTNYWIGYITDTSVTLSQYDNSTNKGQRAANTYGSGAPGTAPAMTTGQPTWEFWGNCTAATTNWQSVTSDPAQGIGPAGDSASITSSTVGNEDLYGFPALTTSPAAVYTVGVKGNMKLTGTGTRTVTLNTKSSATDSAGSTAAITPTNSYGWQASFFDNNPNGPTGWTGTTVNAATSGPKVTV